MRYEQGQGLWKIEKNQMVATILVPKLQFQIANFQADFWTCCLKNSGNDTQQSTVFRDSQITLNFENNDFAGPECRDHAQFLISISKNSGRGGPALNSLLEIQGTSHDIFADLKGEYISPFKVFFSFIL